MSYLYWSSLAGCVGGLGSTLSELGEMGFEK